MTGRLLVVCDPLAELSRESDSTLALMEEAIHRDWRIFHADISDLILDHGRGGASVAGVAHDADRSAWTIGEAGPAWLDGFDVILMRKDPPVDMAYLSACYILERAGSALVVNRAASIRDAPEKIFVTDFADLMPPTLISASARAIGDFRADHGTIVVKSLYGKAGQGVVRLNVDDPNIDVLLEFFDGLYPGQPLVAQKYLPSVSDGDKRIILIDGKGVGAMLRLPGKGQFRSNLAAGGKAEKVKMDDRDHDICARIGSALQEKGLILAGIDVIGGMLTEINVTSPTGIRQIDAFDNTRISACFWDAVERRL